MVHETAGERRIEFHGATGRGAIVFDAERTEQARAEWFDIDWWGQRARAVASGGRGAAWFVDGEFGMGVLRHYRRGGMAARLGRSRYWWAGEARVRSVAELRLLREMRARGVQVPAPIAAWYVREGLQYRAAIIVERISGALTLARRMTDVEPPWRDAGRLIARAHRAGLDHADLNAENILFDDTGVGWLIDLDRGVLRPARQGWRMRNLERLHRSLRKLRGELHVAAVDSGFAELRSAYEEEFNR